MTMVLDKEAFKGMKRKDLIRLICKLQIENDNLRRRTIDDLIWEKVILAIKARS